MRDSATFIFSIFLIGLIAILLVFSIAKGLEVVGKAIEVGQQNPCWNEESFRCKDFKVQQCLESEIYTREECIALIGGGDGK